jgi:hypothetical protein
MGFRKSFPNNHSRGARHRISEVGSNDDRVAILAPLAMFAIELLLANARGTCKTISANFLTPIDYPLR